MTRLQQIKAEIERRREQIQIEIDSYPYECDDQAVYRYCQYLIEEAPDLSPKIEELDEAAEDASYDYVYNGTSKPIGQAWLTRDVRHAFIAGAKWQAQHSLTWEDIENIYNIMCHTDGVNEAYYKEVLKRFNEQKNGL